MSHYVLETMQDIVRNWPKIVYFSKPTFISGPCLGVLLHWKQCKIDNGYCGMLIGTRIPDQSVLLPVTLNDFERHERGPLEFSSGGYPNILLTNSDQRANPCGLSVNSVFNVLSFPLFSCFPVLIC